MRWCESLSGTIREGKDLKEGEETERRFLEGKDVRDDPEKNVLE